MTAETGRWVTGSAYEFLGLSSEEAAYVDLKLRLSKALRRFRMLKPISQAAFAKMIKSSQSRVAKMENGDPSVSIDLLLRALIRLGVTRKEIAKLLVFDEPKPLFTAGTTIATPSRTTVVYHVPSGRHSGSRAGGRPAARGINGVPPIDDFVSSDLEFVSGVHGNRVLLSRPVAEGHMPS